LKFILFLFDIFASRTLKYLDLECCNLTEYAGQLLLTLFTKYPVKLEEIYLDKNSILDSTRTLINECLGLKSRQNSISSDQPLSYRLPINDEDSDSTTSTTRETIQPVKLKKKKKKSSLKAAPEILIKEATKSVGFNQIKNPEKPIEIKKKEVTEEEIEELLPVEIGPYGTVGRMYHWHRV
jgi:hypothetical protein